MTMAVSENKPAEAKEPGQTQMWERQQARPDEALASPRPDASEAA